MTVRVLVADDNPVVRFGLRSLLELDDDIEICAEAESGPGALAAARVERPDVVLLDVRMPGGGGLEVLSEITGISQVLMLTYSDEPAVVSRALRAGATGFLVHGQFQSAELTVAIKDTAAGSPRLSPTAAAVVLSGLTRAPQPDSEPPGAAAQEASLNAGVVRRCGLSRREVEIARLVVRGRSNAEVAAELFIEAKTVKNHINRLFAKLGVGTRPAAIAALLGIRDR